ncbi:aromatic-ring hydroxylase C-terminal domain-containing protein [Streptomyces lydicus]
MPLSRGLEAARTGVVGDVGHSTGAGAGDQGVATLCDHWGDLCPRFPDAAGWRDRLSTVLAAHPADRGDPSAALIRPDGIVARAAAPDPSADTAALATALRTCLGEPHSCMANGQKGEPGQPEGRKGTGQRIGKV